MPFVGNVQLVAGNTRTVEKIVGLLEKEGVTVVGNPDVLVREYSGFGIDEARELGQKASMRPIVSDRRIFIIVTPGMTTDAQNALLKTLEEPAGDALFFLIVPSPQLLLPTLRSRAQLIRIVSDERELAVDLHQFLGAGPQKRIEMLKPLLDKDDDDRRDLAGSIEFLAALERELSQDPFSNKQGLHAVYRARKYIGDKGSLQKALLEQVALLV